MAHFDRYTEVSSAEGQWIYREAMARMGDRLEGGESLEYRGPDGRIVVGIGEWGFCRAGQRLIAMTLGTDRCFEVMPSGALVRIFEGEEG